jgi:putative transposase
MAAGGYLYHVLNRGVGRARLFHKSGDYAGFEKVLAEAKERQPMRLLAYCVMPNHWHLLLWPEDDGDLSEFMRWLTVTHTQRWHAHHHTAGTGPLYQGRFKSFPIQDDDHYLTVCRYVEGNALRAKLASKAEHWRWSSLWHRVHDGHDGSGVLEAGPVELPKDWVKRVNHAESPAEVAALRQCLVRGSPYGARAWVAKTAKKLGLEATLRPRGRPRKKAGKQL